MDVSESTFNEIHKKLKDAGYDHAINQGDSREGLVLDMHGIALAKVCDKE
jgi:hypothetical protein